MYWLNCFRNNQVKELKQYQSNLGLMSLNLKTYKFIRPIALQCKQMLGICLLFGIVFFYSSTYVFIFLLKKARNIGHKVAGGVSTYAWLQICKYNNSFTLFARDARAGWCLPTYLCFFKSWIEKILKSIDRDQWKT